MCFKEETMHSTSNHHRKPRSLGGLSTPENISKVDSEQHKAWHINFLNMTPQKIAKRINEKWIDPAWKFLCVPREDELPHEDIVRTLQEILQSISPVKLACILNEEVLPKNVMFTVEHLQEPHK